MSQLNYRTINIDALDPESSTNFPMESLLPANLPQAASANDAASAATQVRQMLRGGDPEGALRTVLDTAPLGGDDRAKEVHLATVIDVLQGIRQGEMTRILEGVCSGEGGAERGDCLMKYLCVEHSGYQGGSQDNIYRHWESRLTFELGTRVCRRRDRATVPSRPRSRSPPRTQGSLRSRRATWVRVVVVNR